MTARERPFRGACETRFAIVAPILQGDQQVGFMVELTGTCELTHLGRTSIEARQQVFFHPPPDPAQTVLNTAKLTAANGDVLHASLEASGLPVLAGGVPVGFTFNGEDTYEGGTGRFADASGSATLEGSALFDPPTVAIPVPFTGRGSYQLSGTLEY